jgi:hypothetical protein
MKLFALIAMAIVRAAHPAKILSGVRSVLRKWRYVVELEKLL